MNSLGRVIKSTKRLTLKSALLYKSSFKYCGKKMFTVASGQYSLENKKVVEKFTIQFLAIRCT